MTQIKRVFWFALVVKLILAAVLPLTNDEAYYWVWSQNLQLSYYDHPPFVAWLYWLGNYTNFFAGSVRWPGVLLGHATLAVWLKTLRPFLTDKQRLFWLGLMLLSPLVGGSGIVVTPDLPLMFFYAISLWLFFRFEARASLWLALLFGISMGLGLTSKYMMVLFALSLGPLLGVRADLRKSILRFLPALVFGAALGTLPVWWWNFQHDFASFKFQTAHGLGHKIWKPSWTYEYILVQVGLIFPPIVYWAVRARRRLPLEFDLLGLVPVMFFFVTTARGYVEGNWPIVAYPAIFALAVSAYPQNARSLRATLAIWAAVLSLAAGIILTRPNWARALKFKEFHEFDQAVIVARELSPLYARSYQMAAKLHFELGRPVYKVKGLNRIDFYDFLAESTPTAPKIFVVVQNDESLAHSAASGYRRTKIIPVDPQYEIWQMELP